jgi:hypothetical protein
MLTPQEIKAKRDLDSTVTLIADTELPWEDQDKLVDTALRLFDRDYFA